MQMTSKIFKWEIQYDSGASKREVGNVFQNCAVDISTVRCIKGFLKGMTIGLSVTGSRMPLLSHNSKFLT